ncbi:MAG: sulfite exporter TauE/SafE family protein [Bacteroidota bacterium]
MINAFIIGLVGSFHCIGMCGPLMITFTDKSGFKAYLSFITYHFARISVYALIGVLFGLIGTSFQLIHFQKFGAIIVGILIILIYGFPKWRNTLESLYYRSFFYQWIKTKFTGHYNTRIKWLAAGIVNGFLPCGLIYLAAAGAILTADMGSSAMFMVFFGIGTLPGLIVLSAIRNRIPHFFKNASRTITMIALLSGGIMIIRGLVAEDPEWNQLMTQQINHIVTACGF